MIDDPRDYRPGFWLTLAFVLAIAGALLYFFVWT